MLRIRQIYDGTLPANQVVIEETQKIFKTQFADVRLKEVEEIAEKLTNPFKQNFRAILYVAENVKQQVKGFALFLHEPKLKFAYLDFIASQPGKTGQGIGSSLYEKLREDAVHLGCKAIFFECLPDQPDECKDPEILKQNKARLNFYEKYGARPIDNKGYQMPVSKEDGSDNLPYLVVDVVNADYTLTASFVRKVVRAVLERKYDYLCSPEYNEKVIKSFVDPIKLREPLYHKKQAIDTVKNNTKQHIPIVVNDKHDIHHIRERGYVESPVRISSIYKELIGTNMFNHISCKKYPDKHITAVHTNELFQYLKDVCAKIPANKSVYPYIFPVRNAEKLPQDLTIRAGYYCIDTFTPLNPNAFLAARHAVDCSLTAADEIIKGKRLAYSLVRPPGHHAESKVFGGFCYFNNAAVAANYLSAKGKVAILDIDYHHGNGQQDIFYERDDVLTVSIHGSPEFAYPYFTGFKQETGTGKGTGFNLNIELPEVQNGEQYRIALQQALDAIKSFSPKYLVIALGLDPAKGDPTGTWSLVAKDFEKNGEMIAGLNIPTLIVQEGGYRIRTLGTNARHFFTGCFKTINKS